jgi:hypothetical protein
MSSTATKPPCPDPDCVTPPPRCAKRHAQRPSALSLQRGCGARFGQTHHTPMYRLRTPPEEVGAARCSGGDAPGQPYRAAEEITGHNYETIGRWLRLAAEHAEALPRRSPKCWSMISSSRRSKWTSSARSSEEGAPPQAGGPAGVGRALGLRDPGAREPLRRRSWQRTPRGGPALAPRRTERPMPVGGANL